MTKLKFLLGSESNAKSFMATNVGQFYMPQECLMFNAKYEVGPKRDEVTGEWRKLHNEQLNDLYSLPNIVRVVKSRRMRWACGAYGGGERCAQGFGGKA
jgi:hypothetical protein